jgi:hypothetical protein
MTLENKILKLKRISIYNLIIVLNWKRNWWFPWFAGLPGNIELIWKLIGKNRTVAPLHNIWLQDRLQLCPHIFARIKYPCLSLGSHHHDFFWDTGEKIQASTPEVLSIGRDFFGRWCSDLRCGDCWGFGMQGQIEAGLESRRCWKQPRTL